MADKQLTVKKMKRVKVDSDGKSAKVNSGSPPPKPPPPLPPVLRFSGARKPAESVTKREIAKYWRRKRTVEEDHFNAAIKAAARLRARNLSVYDYKCFEESLNEDDDSKEDAPVVKNFNYLDQNKKEIRVGIKDWWTKSKYAYLNQPAIKSMDKRRASTYIPQFYCYKSAPPSTTTVGIC